MLYLWMPEANGVWQWTDGGSWRAAATMEQLIQDTDMYHGKEAVVFFPSCHAQIMELSMPKNQYKKMGHEGVKYLLEEYVVLSIDSMKVLHHFEQPDQLSILGIANHMVETFHHALHLLPFKIDALLPDFLILPQPKDEHVIIANIADRLLVRDAEYRGHSIDDLSLYLDYQPKDVQYLVSNLNAEQARSLEAKATFDQVASFEYLFEGIKKAKQHAFNVLPKVKSEGRISGYWKACAAIFLGILIVQFSYDAVRWYQNKKIANQTATQAIDQFKSWFGQNYPVTEQNIKSQFEGQLRQSQIADTQVFDLIARVGPILMQNQIVAQRVNYAETALSMELKANNAEALNMLVKQLGSQGFKVELGNIQAGSGGAVGLVKIQ